MADYVIRDGSRLTPHMANQIERLNKDFKRIWGVEIKVSSGIRLAQEQIDIFLARYVTADRVNGRTVYDTRVWNGVRYYRISSAGTVAVPSTSNHEVQGNKAAVDLRDTGNDAGVTVAGSARSNWLRANCGNYGMIASGFGFGEAWHYDMVDIWAAGGGGSGYDEKVKREQDWLISRGYDLGPTGADGIAGPKYEAAVKAYQTFLRAYGYRGDIDGVWGDGTQAAHAKYYAEVTAPPANGVPAFPLPSHQWFGPEAGGDNSISGWHTNPPGHPGLKQFQQRMKDRGWPITVDGIYGPKGATTPQGNTAEVVVAFQKEKGLNPDGLIGPKTWDAAWTAPVTPAAPTPAEPNPTQPTTPSTPVPDEASATPNLITPSAKDFPSWIKFDISLDPEGQKPNLNLEALNYYKVPYNPIESHLHWWNSPGQGGTHDGNVSHIKNTNDLSVNFVVSECRITLMVPLSKIALTTGTRNPYAWKSENDPTLSDWQYKTMGYLHYIVEKLNPSLLNEPLRHHKEFYATSCSEIDKAKVRSYAEAFRTGALDVNTGLPPVTNTPDPEPNNKIEVERSFLEKLRDLYRASADEIDKHLD